jgi:hypothetical protein
MAHVVINGARLTVAPDETDLWEMADELISEFSDFIDVLQSTVRQLEPLAKLMPSE